MTYLLRRTKRALAGWFDPLTGRSENPAQLPWLAWGAPRVFFIDPNKGLVLGSDGGTSVRNPDGGIAYEHQPLTPFWSLEFTRTVDNTGDGNILIYVDQNWTEGGGASTTQHQTVIQLVKSSGFGPIAEFIVFSRDKDTFVSTNAWGRAVISQAEYATCTIRMDVYQDCTFNMFVNGTKRFGGFISDARYRWGPRKRAANFAQIAGPITSITNFSTRDTPPFPSWAPQFYDDFDRANSTTVGNGWSQAGGNFGINNNALSMMGGFTSDGYRGIFRGPLPSGHQRVESVLGGGTGNPNEAAETALLLRVNSAGTAGLAVRFNDKKVTVSSFTGSVSSPSFTDLDSTGVPEIVNGNSIAACVNGARVWAEVNGLPVLVSETAGTAAPETNRGFGAMVRRFAFANSAPLNDLRASVAA